MATKFIGLKEFRQNMAKFSEQAQKKNERMIILKKNSPVFELRPLSKKDASLEKLFLDLDEAMDDVRQGRTYSHAEIKKMFGIV
jgi:PHD/YefM family antitoxin component YafN of YafNO toxin-antitoxin module